MSDQLHSTTKKKNCKHEKHLQLGNKWLVWWQFIKFLLIIIQLTILVQLKCIVKCKFIKEPHNYDNLYTLNTLK